MGASFQAPHAALGERQMKTHHVSLIILYFSMLLQQITQVCTKLKLNKYDKRINNNNGNSDNETAVIILK